MINVKEKAKNAVTAIKVKALPVACAVATAVPTLMIGASAEDGVDYSAVTTSLTTGFKEIVTQCVTTAAAIIPIGLGLIGLGKVFSIAKKFFSKATTG